VFRLQRTVAELAIVADSFHTKPLRRFLQSAGRYQILGLSLGKIQLFEGTRDALDEIDPAPGVPRTSTAVLGDEPTESHMTVASYGGVGQGSAPMHHGDGGKQDAVHADAERFFRAVDRAVLEHHSRPSGLPLILAALPEHHHLFHRVSHNPFLLAEGLSVNPDTLPIDELRERAWQVVEPQYQAGLVKLADEFAVAKSNGLGSDDPAEVAQAAAAGRVATWLIESDRMIGGRIDVADQRNPRVEDLLDDLGEAGREDGRPGRGPSGRANAGADGTGCHLPILSELQLQQENTMQIQINTDHNIEGHEALAAQVSSVVESALSLVSDHITRVEVHLSDENGAKVGQHDKRCMMEARLEGRQPIAVTDEAATMNEAVDGAADKLARLIESNLGRVRDQRSHRRDPLPPGPALTPQA
jgi:ribosome-associated translation inhibitor RaiA